MNLMQRKASYNRIPFTYSYVPPQFISQWNTANTSAGSSASNQVKLPLPANGTYNFTVDWGDGSAIDTITVYNQAEVTHTYSSSGIYTIKITGVITGWQFNNTGDVLKILDISKFGPLVITSSHAFHGCSNLNISAIDTLVVDTTDSGYIFYGCTSLISAPSLDLSSVTSFSRAFQGCTGLSDISSLNLGTSVTNFSYGLMQTYSLTTMPLIDFSHLTNVRYTLYSSAITSTALLDLSSVTDAYRMFFDTTLSTTSYSAFLNNLNTLSLQSGVSFDGGNAKYNTGAATARANIISTYGWTITDGGPA